MPNEKNKSKVTSVIFWLGTLMVLGSCLYTDLAFSQSQEMGGIGGIANTILKSMAGIGRLIIAVAYVAGMGFAMASVMKFKAHKDNPQQVPVGTPIAYLAIAAFLIFLPGIFGAAGETLFGSGASQKQGSFSGVASGYTDDSGNVGTP